MNDEAGGRAILIPFEVGHLELIDDIPGVLVDPRLRPLLQPGGALTLVGDDGVLGSGGLVAVGDDRAEGWVVLSAALRRRPMVLHRMVSRVLAEAPFRCVGASVRRGFVAGERWLLRLGFVAAAGDSGGRNYKRYERWQNSRCWGR